MVMKSSVIRLWAASLLFGCMLPAVSPARLAAQAAPVAKPDLSVTQSLLDKARALEERGRMDLAVQTWKQILLKDPKSTEALGGLARAAALSGNAALSQTYLERLRKIDPTDPNLARVGAIHSTPSQVTPAAHSLPEPARLRSNQQPAEAAAYAALNAKHLDEAEANFKAILATAPANARALAGMGYVRMQQGNFLAAISFLEQARLNDPNEPVLAEALDTARFWFMQGEAQDALNVNDLTTAEKLFRDALQLRPDSPEALQGLGNTLLKAQQPQAAIPLFERVVAAQPAFPEGWRGLFVAQYQASNVVAALATEQRFPAAVRAQLTNDPVYLQTLASTYSAAGRNADAQKALERAVTLPIPAGVKLAKADLQMQLAGVLLANHQLDQATALYREVISGDHANIGAWQGLVEVLHASGNDREALATVDGMPPANRTAAMREPAFEATVAAVYQTQKRLDQAQDLLRAAVTQETNAGRVPSAALEMQLADLYLDRGSPQPALTIYRQLASQYPDRVEVWAGLLSAMHQSGQDKEAMAQLDSIPPAVRARLENNPRYLQTMASVYGALGRSREATAFLGRMEQGLAARNTEVPADVDIQDAWLLYSGMDDAGLYRQLMNLGGRTDLTNVQRWTVQSIWTNWALRRAGQAAAAGNSPRALAILNAAVQMFPDNPAIVKELARTYAQSGEPQQAVAIYKKQNMSSVSAPEYATAIAAAMSANDNKDAETWLQSGLAKYPSDPQILLLGAKFEQARGNSEQAMRYYRQSLAAMPPPRPAVRPGLGAASPATLPNENQEQDLSLLLAPGNTDLTPVGESQSAFYQPAPTPAYDAGLVPPYMTNSAASQNVANVPLAAQVQANTTSANASMMSPPQPIQPPTRTTIAAGGSYAAPPAYVAPARPTPSVTSRGNGTAAVTVQLGNDTPPPVQRATEKTDVLPTAKYVPDTRQKATLAADPNLAAAQADRIRRQQADAAAARAGQSHPVAEGSVSTTAQVPQPVSQPAERSGTVPDTGAQQYPQPRTQPTPGSQSARTRQAPIPPPPAVDQAAVAPPVVTTPQPVPAPPVSTNVATPPPDVGPPTPYPVVPPPTDAELAARTTPPLRAYIAGQAPITPRQQAESALASLEGSYSGWFGATGIGRYRSGTAGLDRLNDIESPVELSVTVARLVRFTAVAHPVFLNSGVLGTSSLPTSYVPFLGTLPANTATPPAQQSANGVGGEVQMTSRDFDIAAGSTPREFLVHHITGRLRWRPFDSHLTLYGDRDSVKDTQLSYAGLRDPGVSVTTGPLWGGVIATTGGARLDFGNATSGSGFYISGNGGTIKGWHVQDNTRFGGETGAYFRVGNWPGHGSLTVGGTLSGMHYEHNEVGLTYGHGGYFSPSSYFLAAMPVTFKGSRNSKLHYSATGNLGVQHFRQEEALFYPLDPKLQNSFVPPVGVTCTNPQVASYNCGKYPLTVATAFSYAFNAEVSYRVGNRLYAGAFAFGDNSSNYNSFSGGFFLRYTFRNQVSSEGRPTGLFPVQGFRPLQVP